MKPTLYIALLLMAIGLTSCEQPIVVDYPTTSAVFKAKDYAKDRYFFLDNAYRRYYIKKYAPQGCNPVAPPEVKDLSVWRLYFRSATDKKSNIRSVRVDTIEEIDLYERLERDKHYYLDPVEGFIRFTDSIALYSEQQVAIYMRTADPTNEAYASMQKGGFQIVTVADTINTSVTYRLNVGDTLWHLWTIRPKEPIQKASADTSRFYLMWRHAYSPIDFSDPASFKISVKQIDQTTLERLEKKNDGIFYADIMGLTVQNIPKIQNKLIYNTLFNDLVLPPYDTSFYGLEPFNNPALGEYRDSLIYRYSEDNPKRVESNGYRTYWEIETISRRYITE